MFLADAYRRLRNDGLQSALYVGMVRYSEKFARHYQRAVFTGYLKWEKELETAYAWRTLFLCVPAHHRHIRQRHFWEAQACGVRNCFDSGWGTKELVRDRKTKE